MNSTVSNNQTSFGITCRDSIPGYSVQLSAMTLNIFVLLPIHMCVLWLGSRNFRIRGRLAASEIFTMNLSALEVFVTIIYPLDLDPFTYKHQETIILIELFSGIYIFGQPLMNSLICVERYIAVAHPAMYRNPAFVKHRYISAGLVWMLSLAYGSLSVCTSLHTQIEIYFCSLTISILVITTCSLGVLKILLRPSPGETQKEGMHHQKKRAFVIITGILVYTSVPYSLEILLFTIRNNISIDAFCVLLNINMWLLQQSGIIQPLLYLSKHGVFSCIKRFLLKHKTLKPHHPCRAVALR